MEFTDTVNSYDKVVSFAYDVVDMHREIVCLRAEVERLRKIEREYSKFLNDTHNHNQRMAGAMLAAAIGDKTLVKSILNG